MKTGFPTLKSENFDLEVDSHSNWAASGVQLAFGERPEGRILHISQVVSGLACECRCPACGTLLVAKKGNTSSKSKAHHFAHHNNDECKTASETALHKYAKQLLTEVLHVTLPPLSPSSGKLVKEIVKAGRYDFDEATQEKRIDDVVADVYLKKRTRGLIVEIRVAHACDEQKIVKLSKLNIAAFEIDLSNCRTTDLSKIDFEILHLAPRIWLFHPRLAETMAELRSRREKIRQQERAAEEKEIERERRKAQQQIQHREKRAKNIADALKSISRKDREFDKMLVAGVERAGYGGCIGLDIAGDCAFTVTRRAWQATIFNFLLDAQAHAKSGHWKSSDVGMDWLYEKLKKSGLIHRVCDQFIDKELIFAVQANGCDFENPYRVVWNYLEMLSKRGFCYRHGNRWAPSLNPRHKT